MTILVLLINITFAHQVIISKAIVAIIIIKIEMDSLKKCLFLQRTSLFPKKITMILVYKEKLEKNNQSKTNRSPIRCSISRRLVNPLFNFPIMFKV